MEKFTKFTSRLAPLPIDNIDTDQIIPARFLKTTSKAGLEDNLFCDWRYDAQGNPNPEFILNRPEGATRRSCWRVTTSVAAVLANTRRGR